jgi:isochorismate synthase
MLDRANPDVDLVDLYSTGDGFLFTRNGGGVVGVGRAARAVVAAGADQVARAAATARSLLEAAGREGSGMVVGALPFDGSEPALLTVPQRAVVARGGHGAGDDGASGAVASGANGSAGRLSPASPRRPDPAPAVFVAAVGEALRRIDAGELRKVVLARSLVIPTPSADEITRVLHRLRERDPDARVFAAPIPGAAAGPAGVVIGASPELLVRRTGAEVLSRPLAGTAPRSDDPAADRQSGETLRASVKDRAEHRVVVEAVTDALAPLCSQLIVDATPSLDRTAAVWHLATSIRGRLRTPEHTALDLAAALHPTPAVGGAPRPAALRAIAQLEPVPRGFFAGLVGWVDGRGDGEWVLTLRCLEVRPDGTRLFAGAGIVAGSDPEAELAETEVKFTTLLQALGEG